MQNLGEYENLQSAQNSLIKFFILLLENLAKFLIFFESAESIIVSRYTRVKRYIVKHFQLKKHQKNLQKEIRLTDINTMHKIYLNHFSDYITGLMKLHTDWK